MLSSYILQEIYNKAIGFSLLNAVCHSNMTDRISIICPEMTIEKIQVCQKCR